MEIVEDIIRHVQSAMVHGNAEDGQQKLDPFQGIPMGPGDDTSQNSGRILGRTNGAAGPVSRSAGGTGVGISERTIQISSVYGHDE
jgi:hypothetical protein